MILETIGGRRTIQSACAQLGLSQTRFHEIRAQALAGALAGLESKPAGRPSMTPRESPEIRALKEENLELRMDLQCARVREQIATVMPHLLEPRPAADQKKKAMPPQELFGRRPGTTRR